MTDRFARRVFTTAWVWGVVTLVPMYFIAAMIGERTGVPIVHAEYYYGFIGTALAFQGVFFLIARDPARFRPMMIAGIGEKLAFAVPALIVAAHDRAAHGVVPFAVIDLVFAAFFVASFRKGA